MSCREPQLSRQRTIVAQSTTNPRYRQFLNTLRRTRRYFSPLLAASIRKLRLPEYTTVLEKIDLLATRNWYPKGESQYPKKVLYRGLTVNAVGVHLAFRLRRDNRKCTARLEQLNHRGGQGGGALRWWCPFIPMHIGSQPLPDKPWSLASSFSIIFSISHSLARLFGLFCCTRGCCSSITECQPDCRRYLLAVFSSSIFQYST